ncbi:cell division protein FtsW [Blastococcus fimeti]|nr:cell division protein FtsW [Blastococcus fimeti]
MTTTQTRPRPGRAAREERAPARRWSGPAWLDGPMTSCHLVLGAAGLLLLIGLVMVFSASSIEAALAEQSAWAPGVQQLVWAGLGLGAMLVTMRLPIGLIRRWSPIGLVVVAVLLLLVLVPGIGVRLNGARQWIDLGFTLFQPSELAKIVFALWGAHVLALRERYLTTSSLLVPVLPVFGVLSLLIIAEPDFGGVVSLGLVLTGLLWAGGMPLRWFGAAAAGGAALLAVVVTVSAERRDRLTSFMDPFADPTDSGFQAIRGMYALASGGLWGVGLGNSAMKWNILPEAESDYIFAIIGEELGFLGCLVVVTLYGVLAYAGFRIARRAADRFVQLACVAITVWLVGQATMNMGYVVGLLPVTGVTLPLISAGGTSLILTLAVVGLLARFACTEPAAVESLSSRDRGRIARLLLPAPSAAVEPVRPRRRPEDRDERRRIVGSGRTVVHARSAPTRSAPTRSAPTRSAPTRSAPTRRERPAERPARTSPPPARRPGGQR